MEPITLLGTGIVGAMYWCWYKAFGEAISRPKKKGYEKSDTEKKSSSRQNRPNQWEKF